ncbi:hypothetical protein LY01_01648 [Nonlabens xylanidelens]|uniref:Uncharacterized protein n=2 Tax=Nonlabens xylanidelens TaxID=191564 RepID=A0A2S6IL45_9FLAO|nr:hypothetical protein [Nonlabens xylanidelens]PPK94895.1 hypothetical protein LY01_01648 [Nonlabens xylanidelens]
MNLKKLLLLTILITSLQIYGQTSTNVKVTHFPGNTLVDGVSTFVAPKYIRLSTNGQNCFNFLDVQVYVRASSDKQKPYKFKVEVTNNSNYDVNLATSMWGLGNGGSHTIKSGVTYDGLGGNNYTEKYPTIKVYQIQVEYNQSDQEQYGVPSITNDLSCGQTPESYKNQKLVQKEKKDEIVILRNELNALGNSEEDLNEKLSILKKLENKDPNRNYQNQISNTEQALKRLNEEKEKKRKEEEEKKKVEKAKKEKEKKEKDEATKVAEEKDEVEKKQATINEEREAQERKAQQEKAAEEEKQRKAAERKQARREYEDRVASQNKQNMAVASSAAASSATVLYMLAGVVYQGSGRANPDRIFKGEGVYFGLDFGYSSTITSIGFNSSTTTFDSSDNARTKEEFTDYGIVNINFDVNPKFGYETEHYGGYGYGTLRAGFSPFFDSFGLSYDLGARAYGGLKWVKGYVDYQIGNRSYSANAWLDSEELGSGKANYNFNRLSLGTQFSWYGNSRTAARNHITIGVMFDKITSDDDNLFVQQLEDDNISGDTPSYTGYSFEWKHDHHGILSIEYFPTYPIVGNIDGTSRNDFGNDGSTFIQLGYTRTVDSWFTKK